MSEVLTSSPVADKEDAIADHYNNLRADLLAHNHESETATVDHEDLANKGTNAHSVVDSHLAAAQSIHGIPTSHYPVSHQANQKVVIEGDLEAAGWGSGYNPEVTITFDNTDFTAVHSIVITRQGSVVTGVNLRVKSSTSTNFVVTCALAVPGTGPAFYWMAMGVVS